MLAQNDQFIYNGFHQANLHLDETARIHPNGLLQLTNNSGKHLGYAFYKLPIKFNTSSGLTQSLSFSTNFVFAIVLETPSKGGHGIALTISPSWKFTNVVARNYLGLLNASNNGLSTNHLLAIELDTIEGQEFQDIDNNHVGIDVNSMKSIELATATYFSDQERKNISLELVSGNPMHLWIDYNETEKLLTVTLAPTSIPKPNRPLLSTHINTSQILLESMFVGFSAATGTVTSDHYILGWSFNKSGQAQSLDVSKLPQPPRQRKSKDKRGQIIMILIIAVVVVLILVTGAIFILRRKKYAEILEDWENKYGPHKFSYKNLYKATKGFSNKEILGEGGFGKVYKGTLRSSNKQIAVKKVSCNSKQGMKEFVAEIISMGVAFGLLYPHEEWEQVVLHKDVKASNVLLDAELNGRLGDFGLAKLCDHANPQTTNVAGTVGYLAPELSRTGQPLALMFCFWGFRARECWRKGAILDASDPRLESNYVVEEMKLVLNLGLLCSHSTQAARPSMKQVMQFLDGNADLPELPHDSACFGNFTRVEESEILLSIPQSFGKYLSPSSSTDSILKFGR
uniref:Protein kinase domain-containing protein n=1 Tax=Quercus lobata TaxID=97700 RepID=A0A7N2KP28_QUELO